VVPDLTSALVRGFEQTARALGSSEPPTEICRLLGGLEARTFSFQLNGDRFVVKIYDDNGDKACTEFDNLAVVSVAQVPTPEPVAKDDDGDWFHAPAVVMTALPGRPDMHPEDRHLWVSDAAEALASVHSVSPARAAHVRPPRWQRWQPSTGGMGSESARADEVLARLRDGAETLPTVLSHDDYNPGSLLFEGGRLSGVVDWADVAIEPRHAAVALFRHFLAIHPGGDAPEAFLDAYERAADTTLGDLPLWDVLYGLRGVRPVDHWVLALDGLGLEVTSLEIQERSREWVRKGILLAGG